MNHLNINITSLERDGEIIIGDINLIINADERIALVGPNGIGKSTFMKILSGQITEYIGSIENVGGITLGYLEQIHFIDESKTVRDELKDAFSEIRTTERLMQQEEEKMTETGEYEQYTALVEQLKMLWWYTYENEVERVSRWIWIFHLLKKSLHEVSGGERTKIALAKILLSKPNFLLLDEPTNFIDLSSVEWLEKYLGDTWKWWYLIVSHDREFLDQTCNKVIEMLGPKWVILYYGDYSFSVEEKEKMKKKWEKLYEDQQAIIATEKTLINRFRAGSRAGFAKSRERQLEKVELIEKPESRIWVQFLFPFEKNCPESLIKAEDVFIGRREPLFYIRDAILSKWDRIGIVGENGVGKSTFLKTILGQIQRLEGTLHVHQSTRILYFSQLHESLIREKSIFENFEAHGLSYSREKVGSIIGNYGFSFHDTEKKVNSLSGGERSRLLFAILGQNAEAWRNGFRHRDEGSDLVSSTIDTRLLRTSQWQYTNAGTSETSNLLILDEPTNHLDYETREALEKALREYPGTILFISHDRYFVNKLASKLWIIEDSELIVSYGNYEDYRYKRERGIDLDMSLFDAEWELDLVLEEKLGREEAKRIKEKFARRKKRR
jgi:ATP-binding cassette subfamily F protein 3